MNSNWKIILWFICIAFTFLTTACSRQPSGLINDRNDLDSWIGKYLYNEFWTSDVNDKVYGVRYIIDVYNEENDYFAEIIIDGHLIMRKLIVRVSGDENNIDLIYESDEPGTLREIYEKGDVLLSLKRDGENIFLEWGELKPVLRENEGIVPVEMLFEPPF